ncbi:hypothetical protein K7X08_011762 [Anisodus acutangulus]|uniref:Uncharacterized protein n=1 Tax=Anisodus acutangulus TaxID=402998 RepID=A0A9Q1MKM5_9SOLA|nr:hypothetical protein K7X08_011762 [Anisodus acutangulus]
MVRTRLAVGGDQNPTPVPTPVVRGGAQDKGQEVISEDYEVPQDEEEQGQANGAGPNQVPPSFVATLVLQDTLVHMMSFVESIDQGIHLATSDGSHTRVGEKTPDHAVIPRFQTPGVRPAHARVP